MKFLKSILLISLLLLSISLTAAYPFVDAMWEDESSDITISNGDEAGFWFYFTITEPQTHISIILYDSSGEPVDPTFLDIHVDDEYFNNGIVMVTPEIYGAPGDYDLVFTASDSEATDVVTIYLHVTNSEPVIPSIPDQVINEGTNFLYDVNATDAEGDTLTYSLSENPGWLTINANTGVITGVAPLISSFDEEYDVEVAVSDGFETEYESFEITVNDIPAGPNPPSITSTPVLAVNENTTYTYDVNALDIDVGDVLTYSLTQFPAWLSINSSTGVITGTSPTVTVNTNFTITVQVTDGTNIDTQTYTLTVMEVTNDTTAPIIAILFPSNGGNYDENDVDTLQVQITDANLQSCWYRKNGGSNIFFTCTSGNIININSNPKTGSNTWVVYANDTFGNQASTSITFDVQGGSSGSSSSGGSSGSVVKPAPAETDEGIYLTPKTRSGFFSASTLLLITMGIIGLGIVLVVFLLSIRLRGR